MSLQVKSVFQGGTQTFFKPQSRAKNHSPTCKLPAIEMKCSSFPKDRPGDGPDSEPKDHSVSYLNNPENNSIHIKWISSPEFPCIYCLPFELLSTLKMVFE